MELFHGTSSRCLHNKPKVASLADLALPPMLLVRVDNREGVSEREATELVYTQEYLCAQ